MHPKRDLKHGPVVNWVKNQYFKLYDKRPRDTWCYILGRYANKAY